MTQTTPPNTELEAPAQTDTNEDMIERIEKLEEVGPTLEHFPTLLEALQYRIMALEEKTSVLSLAYETAIHDVGSLKHSIQHMIANNTKP